MQNADSGSPRSGREHKAWGERSVTPGRFGKHYQARGVGDSNLNRLTLVLSHASRALIINFRFPGVPFRSTPGFTLSPAARVFKSA